VIHISQLDDQPKTLRIMRDPNLPDCKGTGTAGFTNSAVIVRDLNSDNIAEVTAGWSSRCADSNQSQIRLALITNGDKYIIRGQGVIGQAGSGSSELDPKASHWPKSYRVALTKLYRKLYG
jgi:hypothetical protein